MGRFYRSPTNTWDEEEDDDFEDFEDEDEQEDEEDEEDEEQEQAILDAIRRGEYKPKRKDPWIYHVLYANVQDLRALRGTTYETSSTRNQSGKD